MMPEESQKGYDDRVGAARAIRSAGVADLDDDPAEMIQEQIARLRWFDQQVSLDDQDVFDLGCGTGFNSEYAVRKLGARRAVGVDISAPTIEFARRTYPGREYRCGDACDPSLSVEPGTWTRALCCEVFEHVPAPLALLDTLVRHLRSDAFALISTPNRPVFSLGYEPSPVNHTHIKEYTAAEFAGLLRQRVSRLEMWGQRFRDPDLLERRQKVLRRNIRDYRMMGPLYWNRNVRRLWKVARFEPLWRALEGPLRYRQADFAFVTPPSDDSIWLCAIVRPAE
jgi:SAM-dependent methyltransferase